MKIDDTKFYDICSLRDVPSWMKRIATNESRKCRQYEIGDNLHHNKWTMKMQGDHTLDEESL